MEWEEEERSIKNDYLVEYCFILGSITCILLLHWGINNILLS